MNLSKKSDLLQVLAAVKLKELDLNNAYEAENRARRELNQFLNIEDGSVKYDLEKFENKCDSDRLKDKSILKNKKIRADVLSVIENVKVALYDQIISKKDLGANLILKGSFDYNVAIGNVCKKMRTSGPPNYSINLEYTLPLNFDVQRNINNGYELAKFSAQKFAEDAVIKENNEWLKILDDWNNGKTRLKLNVEIKKMQMQKYQEDRNFLRKKKGGVICLVLHSVGRELDDATLNVLQNILDLIKTYEKAKILYGENYKYEF
ncbi:MAG: hypothetical protein LBS15_03460 [Endomicrobium sp.]|jgi:hypothetical protein|nr:hypothetical protein [Endomicrobium sp.]